MEVIDVPTPVTYKRYTGNWQGLPDGWYISNSNISRMEPVHLLDGLEGLYLSDQWTASYTGTVMAAVSGRQIIQLLCRKEGKRFMSLRN